jgi:hypothetical protein
MVVDITVTYTITYWVAKRTGLYRWAETQVGPARPGRFQTRFRQLFAISICFVAISVPLQGLAVIVAGIIAAAGLL